MVETNNDPQVKMSGGFFNIKICIVYTAAQPFKKGKKGKIWKVKVHLNKSQTAGLMQSEVAGAGFEYRLFLWTQVH